MFARREGSGGGGVGFVEGEDEGEGAFAAAGGGDEVDAFVKAAVEVGDGVAVVVSSVGFGQFIAVRRG